MRIWMAGAMALLAGACGADTHPPSSGLEGCLDAASERTGSDDFQVDGPSRNGDTEVYVLAVTGEPQDVWTCSVTEGPDGPEVRLTSGFPDPD